MSPPNAIPTIPQYRFITAARAALRLSRADLAKAAGVSIGMLGDWETGRRTPMRNNRHAVFTELSARGIEFLTDGHGLIYGLRWLEEVK